MKNPPPKTIADYTAAVVARIIAQKSEHNQLPCACTLHDILHEATEDITECMRTLIKQGKYKGGITINKIPMLFPIEE